MAKQDWNEKVRAAVRRDGRSLYALAKAADLWISPMQRFMEGTSGLTLDSAERLCKVLGMDLVAIKKKKGR